MGSKETNKPNTGNIWPTRPKTHKYGTLFRNLFFAEVCIRNSETTYILKLNK